MNFFMYDGKSSRDWKIGLSGTSVWDAPARKGELVEVPGRNGAQWVDEGVFSNITVTYPCWIAAGFDHLIDDFRGYLMAHADDYYRLEDTYHPDEFRRARYPGPFTATPGVRNISGKFDVTFDCDPRRFYKEGEKAIALKNGSTVLVNPSYFKTYPMIHIGHMNVGTITMNGVQLRATNTINNVDFDCETLVAYVNGVRTYVSALSYTERPYLAAGQNTVTETASASEAINISIIPRWYTI